MPCDALERVLAARVELQPGAGDEVLDRLRDQHLAALRGGRDAGADHDGEPGDLALVQLAIAGVHAGAHLEAEVANTAELEM